MKNDYSAAKKMRTSVTIRVAGRLFEGHLSYVNQMVESASECGLWPLLGLAQVEEVDRAVIQYLIDGDNREFGLEDCPGFVRKWMEHERARVAAA
jgi:hypothetical protein